MSVITGKAPQSNFQNKTNRPTQTTTFPQYYLVLMAVEGQLLTGRGVGWGGEISFTLWGRGLRWNATVGPLGRGGGSPVFPPRCLYPDILPGKPRFNVSSGLVSNPVVSPPGLFAYLFKFFFLFFWPPCGIWKFPG